MFKQRLIVPLSVVVVTAAMLTTYATTRRDSSRSPDEATVIASGSSAGTRPAVEVWKSPTCDCCKDWVSYLEKAGFPVTTHQTDDMNAVKTRLGLPSPQLASCHTATIEGYVVEGHVPISDIERLLAERPDIVGISAPGMPMKSPGMGSLEPADYDVLSFDATGAQEVFSSY